MSNVLVGPEQVVVITKRVALGCGLRGGDADDVAAQANLKLVVWAVRNNSSVWEWNEGQVVVAAKKQAATHYIIRQRDRRRTVPLPEWRV